MDKYWVIIPAAGVGKRMQADRPKQYLPLLGKTVLEQTLQCFATHTAIAGVVVVLSEADTYWTELDLSHYPKPLHRAPGGLERVDSVTHGLQYLFEQQLVQAHEQVLVHDAARPCLTSGDLDNLLTQGVQTDQGAILAMPVRDTMKRSLVNTDAQPSISHTESRDNLWHALTPQMAPAGVLLHALQAGLQQNLTLTDEASVLEQQGLKPLLIEGAASNIKITRPADLALAAFFLSHHA